LPEEIVRSANGARQYSASAATTPVVFESLNAAMAATLLLYEPCASRRSCVDRFSQMSLFAKPSLNKSLGAAGQPLADA